MVDSQPALTESAVNTEMMEERMAEYKTDTKITIGGRTITLSGHESEEYMRQVADYLNGKRKSFDDDTSYWKLPEDMRNIMLQLNLADDYFKEQEHASELERQLDTAKDTYNRMLQEARAEDRKKIHSLETGIQEKIDQACAVEKEKLQSLEERVRDQDTMIRNLQARLAETEKSLEAREAELQKTREAGQQEKRELAALRQELTSRKETALQASREIDALQKSRQEFNEILGRLQEIRKKL